MLVLRFFLRSIVLTEIVTSTKMQETGVYYHDIIDGYIINSRDVFIHVLNVHFDNNFPVLFNACLSYLYYILFSERHWM